MLETPALLFDGPVTVNGTLEGGLPLGFGVIPPVWTLSVEIAFYFVLQLLRLPTLADRGRTAAAAGSSSAWQCLRSTPRALRTTFGIDLSSATGARSMSTSPASSRAGGWVLAGHDGAWLYLCSRAGPGGLLARRARWP